MYPIQTHTQRSDEAIDYVFDMAEWLRSIRKTEIIVAASATADRAGVEVENVTFDNTKVIVRMTGGLPGERYNIVVSATTSAGQVKDALFALSISGPTPPALPTLSVSGNVVI